MEEAELPLNSNGVSVPIADSGDRLRAFTLARGDRWPERSTCELVLAMACKSTGFFLGGLDGRLRVGEAALLPLGNGFVANAEGRLLSLRLENLKAPDVPQRLGDRLIGALMRRAWASGFASLQIVDPALQLIEALAVDKVRVHQERLDMLDRADPRIARALDYIDGHLGERLTVAYLAEVAHLSAGHFSRNFKAIMGEPVWTYVTRRRCERAKEMLLTTKLPIAEIAFRCGFAHQAHMTTVLGQHLGATPGTIRSAGL